MKTNQPKPTKVRIKSAYGKVHTFQSIHTWANAYKRASYAYQLEMLEKFAKHDNWQPSEIKFIKERINEIKTKHADCLCIAM